ncbi:MAG: carbohydrate-binding domain-containing protein [Candidatus Pseudobacter hemicellulosilyticus]|uniref:Carbohydrate-binding domain-containing protein n=1 Tax=Candidatus Pseudobacter hemicellulosilyticus TaxID=3121375 RepID=A0AAJ5WS86_9BACT|nr:MAG: carbohydrate-binding domain-containing protein [Pseudobacter sp.]
MRTKTWLSALAAVSLTLAACHKDKDSTADTDTGTDTEVIPNEDFVTNTKDTSFTNSVIIKYDGTTATVTNPFSGAGVTVAVTNADVVVTSTVTDTEINYVLSGKASDGSFKLYSTYKYGLILNGVSLINNDGPAINSQSGKKGSVTLLDGTNNQLVDGATYTSSTEDQKGSFFSEGQLVFSGAGSLRVSGLNKHAIVSDDYISITSGTIKIASAVSDGIHVNDYFVQSGGTVTINSTGDGIDVGEGYIEVNGGKLDISTSGDKAHALKSETYTTLNSSQAILLTVAGKASKGIKTGTHCTISKGDITINTSGSAYYDTDEKDISAPAGINCDGNLLISAGNLTIISTGAAGKGITVDGTLTIDGGTINVTASGAVFKYGSDESEAKGIKSDGALVINDGSLSIAAADDGLKSESSITINKGTINITKSVEGIEAPYITIKDGTVNVVSSDDCLNSTMGTGGESNDGSLMTLAGGTVSLSSTAGDPMDSNGNIVMTGGTVIVQGPNSQPEVAIDYNGTFNISGGLLIASGPYSNMAQGTSSTSVQYAVLFRTSVSASTLVTIQDASGNNLVTYSPLRAAGYFVFSSSSLLSGAAYKVLTGGSYSGGANTNGLRTGGTYSGGSQKGTFTISSKLTTVSL